MGAETDRPKAKVAIVNPDGRILTLVRSHNAKKRPGELDLPGGKLDAGETPLEGLFREVEEEMPGTRLHNVTPLDEGEEFLFAATATFPEGGLKLSDEHHEYFWASLGEYARMRDMPDNYKDAVLAGAQVFENLVQLSKVPAGSSSQR